MSDVKTDDLDIDALVTMLGALPEHRSERLDLPLTEQVQLLLDLACAHRPDFRRSIPMQATDHDHLITEVLVKLITALAERSGTVLFEGTLLNLLTVLVTGDMDASGQLVRVVAIDDKETGQ